MFDYKSMSNEQLRHILADAGAELLSRRAETLPSASEKNSYRIAMPRTSKASISSRIVRAPRSAQIAVDPAPATTNTVVSGPSWVTAPRAAPAPEMSAAPKADNNVLRVKTIRTVSGMETAMVGSNATRVMNQVWTMVSSQ